MPSAAIGIPAAASLVGGFMSSNASNKAANTQADAANNAAAVQAAAANHAADLQYQQFKDVQNLNAPFRAAGGQAENKLLTLLGLQPTSFGPGNEWNEAAYLKQNPDVAAAVARGEFGSGLEHYQQNGINEGRTLGFAQAGTTGGTGGADFGKYAKDFSMKDFQADPGYAFRMSEGLKALDRTAASRGGMLSGAALKGASRYGQDMASQEYQNAYNRYQTNRANQLNPLQSIAGVGQTAVNNIGTAGQNYATNAGNAYMNAGNATGSGLTNAANAAASGYVGSANAWSGALGNAYNNYQQNQLMNRLYPSSSTSGYTYGSSGPTGYNAFTQP